METTRSRPASAAPVRAARDAPLRRLSKRSIWPWQLRPLFRRSGFTVDRVDYIVFFPHALAKLRPLEPYLRRVVLGAQTLTVATNPW